MKKVMLRCVLLILTLGWFSREPVLAVIIVEEGAGEDLETWTVGTFLGRAPPEPDDLKWRTEAVEIQLTEQQALQKFLGKAAPTLHQSIQELERTVGHKPGWRDTIKYYKAVNKHANAAKHKWPDNANTSSHNQRK